MDAYELLRWVHVVSATILFGTGLGTAFHMWMAHLGRDPRVIAAVGRNVVLADWFFTTPAVIVQPVSGYFLARLAGIPLDSGWLLLSVALYLLTGACWLPVVWLQMRMARLAAEAARQSTPLPPAYFRAARAWFWLGWPAFIAVLAIIHLMLAKPSLG